MTEKKKKNIKLSLKTALIIASILFSFMSVASYIMTQRITSIMLDEAKQRSEDISILFAKINSLPLSRMDYYALENNTRELLKNNDILLAEIYDESNFKVTRSKNKNTITDKELVLITDKDIFDYENKKIGSLKIGLSLERTYENINNTRLVLILIMSGALVITAISIIILIRIIINKPLLNLIESVNIVSEGNLSHKVKIVAKDEIGDLSEKFNLMTDKLRKSQKLINNIITYMPSILIAIDKESKITNWNRAAEKFSNIGSEFVINKSLWEVYPAFKCFKKYSDFVFEHYLQKDIPREEMIIAEKKMYFNVSIFPLIDNNEIEGVVFRLNDITDLEVKDMQLKQAQKMETIGTLAGGLAHDFNNVLAGIIGTVSLMKYKIHKGFEIEEDKLKKYIETIDHSGSRAKDMVQQLLSLSRKHELNFSALDLNFSIKHVMKICKSTFDKSIKLKPEFSKEEAIVKADITQIEQVILNLCVNASHAMTFMKPKSQPQGGELIVGLEKIIPDKYFIDARPEAKEIPYWRISVKDQGIGMSSSTIAKIFDPFFTTKDKGRGTGLGMAMVYNIVKQHNGFIGVYSELGLGTTINIYIPELTDKNRENYIKAEDEIIHGTGTILVVDDEDIIRNLASAILEECGYKVITAVNGLDGVNKYKENSDKIDLVLLDMVMPELSGDEAFEKLKEINSDVKVILSSGFKKDSRVGKILRHGVLDFIQKPYTIIKLSRMVAKYLNSVDE